MKLDLQDIKISFGKTRVIHDLDLQVREGEILALVGESGCGKTTVLRMIAGLETPDQGCILLTGSDITNLSPEKRRVGMVFQNLALFPHLTTSQNIGFGVKSGNKHRVHELIKLTGLEGLEGRYPHELSGGQQQRVALARTLANDPEVLLLDEPFSSLDELTREKVRAEIFQLIKSLGITTILVTHHPIDSFMMADRVVIMKEGKILQSDTPANIYRNPISGYVADFFGACVILPAKNINGKASTPFGTIDLKLTLPETDIFIRPENISLEKHSSPNLLRGNVHSKLFKGPHEVLVIQNEDNTHQILLETEHSDFNTGDPIYLRPQIDKILELKK